MRFKNTIVRRPTPSLVNGITTANLGIPDYDLACDQHEAYIDALRQCGVQVSIMDGDDRYPDACFIEDTALCTPSCAIIMKLGAKSRKGEQLEVKEVLQGFYDVIYELDEGNTAEAGDIMMVGDHYYIGLSDRTNLSGAEQIIGFLKHHGMNGSVVEMKEFLHLKTGLSYLENDFLCITGEFVSNPIFDSFNKLVIDHSEEYSANCIWVNDKVIVPSGYLKSRALIQSHGFETIEVDVSEFRKLDGGLSCLSLRF